jgi:hypothetical protein
MGRQLIEKVIEEARDEGASLVIWDRRDTFTVESDDVKEIEANDDHLRVKMHTSTSSSSRGTAPSAPASAPDSAPRVASQHAQASPSLLST